MRDQNKSYRNHIYINENILKMCKIIRSYKNYGISNIVGSKVLFRYIIISIVLFGFTILTLYLDLAEYYGKIIKLSIIYKWQKSVFSLILDFYMYVAKK